MKSSLAFVLGAVLVPVALIGLQAAFAGDVATPNQFVSGTPAVAAEVNENFDAVATAINDNDQRLAALESRPWVMLDGTSATLTDDTATELAWETDGFFEGDDPFDMHDETDPTRVTIARAGIYEVRSTIRWGASGAGDIRELFVRHQLLNGSRLFRLDVRAPHPSTTTYLSGASLLPFQVGESLSVQARQVSGGDLSCFPQQLSVRYVAPLGE